MATIHTSRSGTNIDNNNNNGSVDYSPSSSISNLKQKFNQSATKNYVSSNTNNYLHSHHNSNNNGDSGVELSPTGGTSNQFVNSSSTTNVNSIINNFTNLNLNSQKNGHHNDHHHGNINGSGNNISINGNHNLTASNSIINSDKYSVCGQESKCLRCGNLVYALERIGPIKGNIYHKTCFKCLICDRQLDLKTYYTNQIDLNERQIYCQSHAPKSGKGVFGADNLYIQNILNGPRLDVMQKVDNKPKVGVNFARIFFPKTRLLISNWQK
jgi:hypothetical protein